MLTIRDDQAREFALAMRRRFVGRMARHLRSVHPEATINETDLTALIERGSTVRQPSASPARRTSSGFWSTS